MQAPHEDVSQPMFVPVSASRSRSTCTSRSRGSTSSSCRVPLTVSALRAQRIPPSSEGRSRAYSSPAGPAKTRRMVAVMIEIREIGERRARGLAGPDADRVRPDRAGSVDDYLDWKRQAEDMAWFVASADGRGRRRRLRLRRLALGAGHRARRGVRPARRTADGRRLGALPRLADWVPERGCVDARDDAWPRTTRTASPGPTSAGSARSAATRGSCST